MRKTILISVPLHPELLEIAQRLIACDWELITTEPVTSYLMNKDISVTDISDFTGFKGALPFPPTLHPLVEKSLTDPEGIAAVYDIPYTLEKGNDVGGHTLLALAAKGGKLPISSVHDMISVIESIETKSEIDPELAKDLQHKANLRISRHYLGLTGKTSFSGVVGERVYQLMNGENPYQVPAYLSDTRTGDPLALPGFSRVSGEAPCFTNMADLDAILDTMCRLHQALVLNKARERYIAIAAKHGNPCGIGVSQSKEEAIEKALWGDAKGIWGGEVIVDFPLDRQLSELLIKSPKRERLLGNKFWMLDVVAAPSIDSEGIQAISKSEHRKVFVNPALLEPSLPSGAFSLRQVRGGFLSQPSPDYIIDLDKLAWHGARPSERISLLIAWAAAFTSFHGGNEVAIAKDNSLLGVTGGPSTFAAAKTAVERVKDRGHDSIGSSFCADAFFPFTDAPELLSDAGCTSGTVPGGGKREQEVIEFFKEKEILLGIIPDIYRGFCRH